MAIAMIVAIPTLLFGTLLSGRASAIMDAMERAALQIINIDSVKNATTKITSCDSPKSSGDDVAIESESIQANIDEVDFPDNEGSTMQNQTPAEVV